MAAAICIFSFLYCSVFFLDETKHKLAALFAIDALVLAALFFAGAAPAAAAAFILSAAAANITVFFIPESANAPALGPGDFAAMAGNVIAAGLGAFIILKNPQQSFGAGRALNPVITAFLFMAFSTALFFVNLGSAGGEK